MLMWPCAVQPSPLRQFEKPSMQGLEMTACAGPQLCAHIARTAARHEPSWAPHLYILLHAGVSLALALRVIEKALHRITILCIRVLKCVHQSRGRALSHSPARELSPFCSLAYITDITI